MTGLDGRQRAGADSNLAQALQKVMLNGIFGLLEVHETNVQGPFGKLGMVNEMIVAMAYGDESVSFFI